MPFRFRNLEDLGDRLLVPLAPDTDGFVGRECPVKSCELYFKVKTGTGLTGPNLPCTCPYCGHKDGGDHFYTKEQIEYAKSVALRQFSDAIGQDLKQLEFRSRPGVMLGISLTVKEGSRPPIAHYRERALETRLTCSSCKLEYSIFGLFAFCPDCGQHNSVDILRANLALVGKQIALALSQDDPELRRHLLEDSLENCVSSFDGFGREATRVANRVSDAEAVVSFQNLERAAVKVQKLFGVDMRSAVAPQDWASAQRSFMKRHLLSHRSGIVDEQYLAETSDPSAVRGHRVTVGKDEIEETAGTLLELGDWLISNLPTRTG